MQQLYAVRVLSLYRIRGGYFIIDDTLNRHTNFCRWIHGVCVLFDHTAKTNLKAVCLVVLYYSDGAFIKFPICFRICYRDDTKKGSIMPWRRRREFVYKTKYELAVEMLEWAVGAGFPKCTVLADSWFGIGPGKPGLPEVSPQRPLLLPPPCPVLPELLPELFAPTAPFIPDTAEYPSASAVSLKQNVRMKISPTNQYIYFFILRL